MSDYSELLKHPMWQKRRLEIMNIAEFKCQMCLVGNSTLHVHHLSYKRGNKPWEYPDENFACLCEKCHNDLHASESEAKKTFGSLYDFNLERAMGYIKGLELSQGSCHATVDIKSDDYAVGIADAFAITKSLELRRHTVEELCAIAITGE